MNKELILKTLSLVEEISIGSLIKITKDDKVADYKLQYDEYGNLELICTTEKDAIWNDYETFEEVKIDLICDAVRGYFEDINL